MCKRWMSCSAVALAVLLAGCAESVQTPDDGSSANLAPLYLAGAGSGVRGEYLVVFKERTSPASVTSALAATGVTPRGEFSLPRRGFGAALSDAQLTAVRRNPLVDWVEQNMIMTAGKVQTMDGNGDPWGLDRIDQTALPLDGQYVYRRQGVGVVAYVFDTGIKSDHSQFELNSVSRVQNIFDGFGGDGEDCDGHGTHVAGTIGARVLGVAKQVQLRGLRVLDCNGTGTSIELITGISFVLNNLETPSVANFSLGFGAVSKTVNTFVDALWAADVFVVASAGNKDTEPTGPETLDELEASYACNQSPASALGAFTVAASDKFDQKATFSNWGRCVDIYAPGVAILSTWWPGGTAFLSGTSMAAPHVAGVAALLRQVRPDWTVFQIEGQILKRAVVGAIVDNDAFGWQYGTPNLLLHKGGL